jgi:putative transposase
MSYSIDLREKVIKFIENGGSIIEAARIFDISRPTIYRWLEKKTSGSLKDSAPIRPWRKVNPQKLVELVEKYSDWTLVEYAKYFKVKATTIFKAFKRLKITRKKRLYDIKKGMKSNERYFWSR